MSMPPSVLPFQSPPRALPRRRSTIGLPPQWRAGECRPCGADPHHPGPLLPPPSPRPGEEGGVSAGCWRSGEDKPRPTKNRNKPSYPLPLLPSGRGGGREKRANEPGTPELPSELFERIDRRPDRVQIERQPLTAGDRLQCASAGPQDVDVPALGVELEDLQSA